MSASHPAVVLWVFTEHRNATYLINFELPLLDACRRGQVVLRTWSSEEVESLGRDQALTMLAELALRQKPTAIVFSRYVQPYALALMDWAKAQGIPRHFHLDDLLDRLPPDIGESYSAKYTAEFQRSLHACLGAADTVLASTSVLANCLQIAHPGKPMHTLQGVCYLPAGGWNRAALRSRLARAKRRLLRGGALTVGYMGSSSHRRDLEPVVPALLDLMSRHGHLRFETLGLPVPADIARRFPGRVGQIGYTRNYQEFLRTLFELGWDLGIAPLVDDDFNRAKTATKFVEYTASGVPTVCAAMTPYTDLPAGAACLATPSGWTETIEGLLRDPDKRRDVLLKARAHCQAACSAASARLQLIGAVTRVPTDPNINSTTST